MLRSHWFELKEVGKFLLFVIPHIKGFFLQPLRKFNFRDRIRYTLQNSWNAHHFLNLSWQPLEIVVPVQYLPDVRVTFQQIIISSPPEKKISLSLNIRIKNLSWNSSLGYGSILRITWDDEVTAKTTFAFDNIRTQKLCQSPCWTQCYSFWRSVITQLSTKHSWFLKVV